MRNGDERLQLMIDACRGLQNDRLRSFIGQGGIGKVLEKLARDGREEELRRALEDVIADLKNIVCVEEPDAGVVLLSNDGPSDWDEKQKCYVYRHQYFSPLGDALIALHEKLTATLNPKGPA